MIDYQLFIFSNICNIIVHDFHDLMRFKLFPLFNLNSKGIQSNQQELLRVSHFHAWFCPDIAHPLIKTLIIVHP